MKRCRQKGRQKLAGEKTEIQSWVSTGHLPTCSPQPRSSLPETAERVILTATVSARGRRFSGNEGSVND